jgi:hypothetical protein
VLGWEPEISLEQGLRRTYEWIEDKLIDEGVSQVVQTVQLA